MVPASSGAAARAQGVGRPALNGNFRSVPTALVESLFIGERELGGAGRAFFLHVYVSRMLESLNVAPIAALFLGRSFMRVGHSTPPTENKGARIRRA